MAGATDFFHRHGVVGVLIAVNVAVWVVAGLSALLSHAGVGTDLTNLLALPSPAPLWLTKPWTLITYMFTHIHPLHLLMNMLWLGWFGSILLPEISGRKLLWLYIAGGLCGGLVYLYIAPLLGLADGLLMGASAAVLAIMTAAAVMMPHYTVHLFFLGDVKLKWIALFMILLAFLGLGENNAGGALAHLGGAICGLIWGMVTSHHSANKRKQQPKRHNQIRVSRVVNIMEQHRHDAERLDELLDKIRISGFDSLTAAERAELEELSRRVVK